MFLVWFYLYYICKLDNVFDLQVILLLTNILFLVHSVCICIYDENIFFFELSVLDRLAAADNWLRKCNAFSEPCIYTYIS